MPIHQYGNLIKNVKGRSIVVENLTEKARRVRMAIALNEPERVKRITTQRARHTTANYAKICKL